MPVVGNQTNVSVTNTPNVNATVVGTPNVAVTNTPNVSVTNTPTVNIGNSPAVKRVMGATKNLTNTGYTVPGGTYFEGTIIVGGGGSLTVNGATTNGTGVYHVTLGAGTSLTISAPGVISGIEFAL